MTDKTPNPELAKDATEDVEAHSAKFKGDAAKPAEDVEAHSADVKWSEDVEAHKTPKSRLAGSSGPAKPVEDVEAHNSHAKI